MWLLELKVAYYSFFSNNSVRDARARQATQDLSRIQNSRELDKENPENKPSEKTSLLFWGFSRSNFVANFLDI